MEEDIVKIIEKGEKKGRPDARANLGYFERDINGKTIKENADNVCVLVVHYDFKNARDPKIVRHGDKKDIINLERTFKQNRKCNFRNLLSPKKEVLLQLLRDQDSLLVFFGSKDAIPSVFVLYILSHGDREGVIYTDHYQSTEPNDFDSFTTVEIFESLKQLSDFEECFKIVNFGPCRGEIDDVVFNANQKPTSMNNEKSTQITFSPQMRNLVVFYSTVETTRARRNESGSTFAYLSCQVLDSLEKDEPVINVLTSVQLRVHRNLNTDFDFKENKYLGQTPEVKLFAHTRNFIMCNLNVPISSGSTSDGIGAIPEKPVVDPIGEFYPWASPSGENMRHRRAFILFTEFDHTVKGIREGLLNLDFEVSDRILNSNNLKLYVEGASSLPPNVGCITTCLFAQVSETSDTNEVCVLVDNEKKKISELLHRFIGPKNEKWIGKPKIFFVLNQTGTQSDYTLKTPNYNISATNHSGWLVLVLHDKEKQQKLINILKGQELKRGRCLQELLASLLVSKENQDLLNTTLQFKLDFPDFPRSFVQLDFSFMKDGEYFPFETIGFDELLEMANPSKVSKIWLLSSDEGAGKSTVLKEMAFELKKTNPEFKIFRIALSQISFNTSTRTLKEFEFLAKFTHHSLDEVTKSVQKKKCIVFLDGLDEICPDFRKKMLKLIEVLKQEQISVWIGTRPHVVEAIKTVVSDALLVEIEPLNNEKQVELYKMETGKSENDCETFIKYFPLKDILKNPLHLSLVAQCGDEDNLYKIYDKVIRRKVEECLIHRQGYGKDNPKFQEKVEESLYLLQNIAFQYIYKGGCGEIDANFEQIYGYGIVSFDNGSIIFSHQTFAEFLTTEKFIRDITVNTSSNVPLFDLQGMKTVGNKYHREKFGQRLKFLDLFYSTVNNENFMKVHREIVLAAAKSNPANFMKLVIFGNLKCTFGILKPYISFSEREEDYIYLANDIELLTLSIEHADEIAAQFVEMDFLESEAQLVEYLPSLFYYAERYNAISFLMGLRQKFRSLPELIKSKESEICAGSWAIRMGNSHDKILEFLVQTGIKICDLETALYISCTKGKVNRVKMLLEQGAKGAKTREGEYCDPLMVAVQSRNLNLVKFLLEEKISGFQRDAISFQINGSKERWNAFHCSIFYNCMKIAKFLLEKSPNIKSLATVNDESPLHLAVMCKNWDACIWLVDEVGVDLKALLPSGYPKNWRSDTYNLFLDYFVMLQKDIHRVDERGRTALMCAVEHGYVTIVHKLIESGVNIRAKDENGWNAFHFACSRLISEPGTELIQLLHNKDGLLAKETTEYGQTGLHIFLEYCEEHVNESFLDYLIDKIGIDAVKINDITSQSALDIASERKLNCVDYLMTKDVKLDFRNIKGQSCLHVAAERGDLEALRAWIALRGDLSHQEPNYGWAALHFAVCHDHFDFVNELLVSGVDVNSSDKFGRTALHLAVFYDSNLRPLEFLLKNGADVNKADFEGKVPLHYAAKRGSTDVVDKLLEFGGDLTLTDSEGKNAAHHAIHQFPMFIFIAEKNIDLVKQRLHNGDTSLHFAIRSKNVKDAHLNFGWFVEQGVVDLNARNKSGETALLLACKLQFWGVSQLLLRTHGVDVHAKDQEGKCALDYAENVTVPDLDLVQKLKELA